MAEPPAANGPRETPAPQPPPVPPDQAASAAFRAAEEALRNPNAAVPSDDTPTIISRKPPPPVPPDEALAGVLRGRHLAHFELLEPIGVGGMAAVIRARDTQLDRSVALKILPPEMAADPENVRRFHQEARAAARLDHENIARAFFCGADQGLHFIAFEFVEGDNLRTLLERRGRIPVPEAINYMLQIATGLAHAAARGVVHRDIKPSNIIISPNGRAKLVDMGLARSLHADHGLTQSGVTLGTFDYISPEQAMEPRDADVRSDIYSLGCTFYHMVTGQPPVPDGTAARKLHHHQHVAPVDPRQLNPAVPDDVAAVLARMMAKDPKDRYQRPEHLVQHLIQLAQKLGTIGDVPEGVLFVDAPLPGPPRTRPMLLAALAVAAVVAVVLLLGPSAPWMGPPHVPDRTGRSVERGPAAGVRDARADGPDAARPQVAAGHAGGNPARAPGLEPVVERVHSARELADVLAKSPTTLTVELEGEVFDLKRHEQLVFHGSQLTLRAADPERPPTVRLRYDGSPNPDGDPWAALTVGGGRVKVVGLRFEVNAAEAPDLVMAAVAQRGGHVTLEKCAFVQLGAPAVGQGSLSAVAVGPPADGERPPVLDLSECLFLGGQRAVTVAGMATVKPTSCAFGPFAGALFDVRAGKVGGGAELMLDRCTAFVEGAVFRLDERASCRVKATHCLFARPAADAATPGVAALAQQTGAAAGAFQYDGRGNAYHNLKAYWLSAAAPEKAVTRWDDFRRGADRRDERSHELTTSPWAEADPLAALARQEPQRAFRVKDSLPALRQPDDPTQPIGVLACTWGPTYAGPLPPLPDRRAPAEAVARKDKIVDPTVTESGNGTYPSLAQALGDARPGDVILIKHSGVLKVGTVRLEKPGLDVTVKPHPDCRPVLTLGETTDADAALFRVHDGQLRLEGLEFHLPPPPAEFKTQSVVALVGDGQCTFKDCVATLEETREVQMALVTVADPGAVMRGMGTAPRPGPRVRCEGCFVRGAGDLVAVRPSRAFDLKVEESLLALDGSLLVVDGNPRDQAAGTAAQVSLKRVTTYLTDHLLWLRANKEEGKPRGLATTQVVSVLDCLFAAAGGKALVHLDGVDTDDQMKRLFEWREARHNAYSNFTHLLEQQPREEAMMALPPYDRRRWEQFTQEADGHYERAKFAAPPAEGLLARVQPADFKVKVETELQGFGTDVERLPQPTQGAGDAEPSD